MWAAHHIDSPILNPNFHEVFKQSEWVLFVYFCIFSKQSDWLKKSWKVWDWVFVILDGEQLNGPENNPMCNNATTVASNNSTQNSQVYDILTTAHLGCKILQLLFK